MIKRVPSNTANNLYTLQQKQFVKITVKSVCTLMYSIVKTIKRIGMFTFIIN